MTSWLRKKANPRFKPPLLAAPTRATKPKKSLNVPVAGWLLSVVTFLLGSVIQPIYNRLTFDGISVAQLQRLEVAYTYDGVFEVSTVLKIVNSNKEPVVIEAVSGQIETFSPAPLKFLSATAFVAKEPGPICATISSIYGTEICPFF